MWRSVSIISPARFACPNPFALGHYRVSCLSVGQRRVRNSTRPTPCRARPFANTKDGNERGPHGDICAARPANGAPRTRFVVAPPNAEYQRVVWRIPAPGDVDPSSG